MSSQFRAKDDSLEGESLVGLALHQLFCDGFNIEFNQQDREKWIKDRRVDTPRSLADAIKDWHAVNDSKYSYYKIYSLCIDQIYKALWGMDAKALEGILGCDRNMSRVFMNDRHLQQLELAESLVMDCIDLDHCHPLKDAVPSARIRRKQF